MLGAARLAQARRVANTATWDPAHKASTVVLSDENRRAANSVDIHRLTRSTTSKTAGLWYAEVSRLRPTTNTSDVIGIVNSSEIVNTYLGGSNNSMGVTWDNRLLYNNVDIINYDNGGGPDGTVGIGNFNTGGSPYTVGLLVNVSSRWVRFYDSDGSVSSNFALNHPCGADGLNTGALFLAVSLSFTSSNTEDDNGVTLNTGQEPWAIGLPSGATAWG